MGKQENIRDHKRETNIWLVCNANVTSAHGVQDDGEGYNEMLNRLSAEDEMQIEGWSTTCYFETILLLQVHGHTKVRNMKHKRNKKKVREMRKEKEIKRKWIRNE